ncbi:MAG TPA: tripartite tricarboxylate transporter TctB family protein [Methylomirabilota bacterium]|nr:tripartite tricarboxylate transporter TctB family protein [Methylomirabilota bacterium]
MADGTGTARGWLGAAVLVAAGLVYLLLNRAYPLDTLATPGPGIFPLAGGALLVAAAAWELATAWRSRGRAPGPPAEAAAAPPGERAALALIGVLVVYVAVLGRLGFFAASFVLVVVASRLTGAPGWRRPLALALGVTAGSYVLFAVWLGVPLPAGLLR